MRQPNRISGQHGGVGRYTVPAHTTKRRTTNLKTKNNQNCQKIKLCGSLTTKEIKKTHSSRPVGGAGIWAKRTCGKTAAGGPSKVADCGAGLVRQQLEDWGGCSGGSWSGRSHICVQINWEEQLGSKTD